VVSNGDKCVLANATLWFRPVKPGFFDINGLIGDILNSKISPQRWFPFTDNSRFNWVLCALYTEDLLGIVWVNPSGKYH